MKINDAIQLVSELLNFCTKLSVVFEHKNKSKMFFILPLDCKTNS